jgi:hypothetical protein
VIDLPEEQKAGLVCIREEITKQLEYRPSQLYMLHLVRPVYASPTRAHAPFLAPLPPQVIPHAGVGTGFLHRSKSDRALLQAAKSGVAKLVVHRPPGRRLALGGYL